MVKKIVGTYYKKELKKKSNRAYNRESNKEKR